MGFFTYNRLTWLLVTTIMLFPGTGLGQVVRRPPVVRPPPQCTPADVEAAIQNAIKQLYAQQKNGHWEGNIAAGMGNSGQHGGKTALVVYALLVSGESPTKANLALAIDWLKRQEIRGTYALALRQLALDLLPPDKQIKAIIDSDVNQLLTGVRLEGLSAGMYSYQCDPRGSNYDHSCANYGAMGVWAAAQGGYDVPKKYWQLVDAGWKSHQLADGGWNYMVHNANAANLGESTVSMTAAGLTTLFITQEYLDDTRIGECKSPTRNENIDAAVNWMAANFDAKVTTSGYHMGYTLFTIQRVGLGNGFKYFDRLNWYQRGADLLVSRGNVVGMGESYETAFNLAFLSLGRAPVAINKLEFPITAVAPVAGAKPAPQAWNQRPRDIANFTRWMGKQAKRPLNWQVVTLDMSIDDLQDAPILYISGSDPPVLTDAQTDLLRQYVLEGGLIVGNANCGNKRFAKAFTDLGAKLFPQYAFRDLPADHPIFVDQQFKLPRWKTAPPKILGMENGARELMLLLPADDHPRWWQRYNQLLSEKTVLGGKEESFQIPANIFLHAIEKTHLKYKGENRRKSRDPSIVPKKAIKIARASYGGNWNPEPFGWVQLAGRMRGEQKVDLKIEQIRLGTGALDKTFAAVHLTGTEAIKLTDLEREELRRFCYEDGLLIIDSCGGSEAFSRAIEEELKAVFDDTPKRADAKHPVYSAGYKITSVDYRDTAQRLLQKDLKMPRLEILEQENRVKVIFSPQDLSVGLVGHPVDAINGYTPEYAQQIMTNAILLADAIASAGKK